jgi:hypothetical protein
MTTKVSRLALTRRIGFRSAFEGHEHPAADCHGVVEGLEPGACAAQSSRPK